jgi:EAL domain-containing protein (putative c-di-GMP-specific phosphodiesterase class I)
MLPNLDDPLSESRNVAARMLRAFDTPVNAGSELVSVDLSIGITHSRSSTDADALIRDADLAMYQAKAKGKSRFEFFDPAMAEAMLRRHDIKEDLAKAIEREQIVVEYQPIVCLDTGRVNAAEALVRWQDPVRGLIGPSEFISLAEETGLIRAIGKHVLVAACRQARRWNADDMAAPVRVHVNLSALELRDSEFIPSVCAILDEFELPPEMLTLEITESELLEDAKGSAARFEELRRLGVRISLDDFGTGYSSLSYLHSLPLDSLKIAKPFVDGLVGGNREAGFIAMIVDLARALGLDVIAEGIETPTQLAALRELGVEYGQGYLLGRPDDLASGRFRRQAAAALSR